MKLHSLVTFPFLFLPFLLPITGADLNSDIKSLLDFATAVRHGRKLNWSDDSPVCTSWVGITCTNDGARVLTLRLPGAGLFGTIRPNTLGNLNSLTILSLRANGLNGTLPSDILSLPSLRYINLQENNFSGEIPPYFSSQLELIDLSFNSFTGSIPPTIQNLTLLSNLRLENNSLIGSIPDLDLPRLKNLSLSNNHLNGSIPSPLQDFDASAFEGNSMLCGPPLSQCASITSSPSPSPKIHRRRKTNKKLSLVAILSIGIGASALLFVLVMIIVMRYLRKKDNKGSIVLKGKAAGGGGRSEMTKEDFESGVQEAKKNRLVFSEGCSYNFDLEDLLRASAEVLGKGTYGRTYKAILEDGTTVVVKRLKEAAVSKREFEEFMEIVGMLGKHPNVIPPRAYYHSKDEKLLIYDYVSFGSLSSLLHGISILPSLL